LSFLPIFLAIFVVFRTFWVIFLLHKVSEERVGGLSFVGERGGSPFFILTCFELWLSRT
jgi:hypothetical protein